MNWESSKIIKSEFQPFLLGVHIALERQEIPSMEPRPIFLQVLRSHFPSPTSVYVLLEASSLKIIRKIFIVIWTRLLIFLGWRTIGRSPLQLGHHLGHWLPDSCLVLYEDGLNFLLLVCCQSGHLLQIGLPIHDNILQAHQIESASLPDGFHNKTRQISWLQNIQDVMALVPRFLGFLVSARVLADLLAQSPHDELALRDVLDEGRLDIEHKLFLMRILIILTVLY